jgi:DNA polymerase alpha subunit B
MSDYQTFKERLLKLFELEELDSKVFEEFQTIAKSYKLEADELYYKYDAFAIKNQLSIIPNLVDLNGFSNQIAKDFRKSSKMLTKETIQLKAAKVLKTPQKYNQGLHLLSSPPVGGSAFSPVEKLRVKNENKGSAVKVLNGHIKDEFNHETTVTVNLFPGQQTSGYRYMYERLSEKGDLLNERINVFANLLGPTILQDAEYSNENGSDLNNNPEIQDYCWLFAHPKVISQKEQYYVGRITSDSLVDGTPLNIYSVLLESSTAFGGARVKLEFPSEILQKDDFDLFPGQIICVKGNNFSGDLIKITRIVAIPDLPSPTTTALEYKQYYKNDEKVTNIVFCSGPFTKRNKLDFSPLDEFVSAMEETNPDVIILSGPFVDVDHVSIQNGLIDLDVFEIFSQFITPKLIKLSNLKKGIQVALIPSQQDSCLEWVAFPQPPLGSSISNTYENLSKLNLLDPNGNTPFKLFPNPVQFTINEIVISITKADVISDMVRQQVSQKQRFQKCFKNILNQRHFYPIFPPNKKVNLDSTRALLSNTGDPCVLGIKPDILIAPSTMHYFADIIDDVICINPQKSTLGNNLGFYTRLQVCTLEHKLMAESDVFENCCSQRTKVEIIQL